MIRTSGSIYARIDQSGNLELGATHVGGLLRWRNEQWVTVIERADIGDLVAVVLDMYTSSAARGAKMAGTP